MRVAHQGRKLSRISAHSCARARCCVFVLGGRSLPEASCHENVVTILDTYYNSQSIILRSTDSQSRLTMIVSTQTVRSLKAHNKALVNLVLKAGLCRKADLPDTKVRRWPYETTEYSWYNWWMDPFCKKKFNENTKIIQVEGLPGAGKEEFAKKLADELGMYYLPKPQLESYYYSDFGYDYRALNPLVPERIRACDWEMFHENPARHSVIHLIFYMYKLRLYQYMLALQHLYNTGQGVVMAQTVFTERVYPEAMHEIGWLPKGYLRADGVRFYDYILRYRFLRNVSLHQVPAPHLAIYLKRPIDDCMETIRNSPDPMIRNSKALIPEFLEAVERAYENVVLPLQERSMFVIEHEYDRKHVEGEVSDVIDQAIALDYVPTVQDSRFELWKDDNEGNVFYRKNRMCFTSTSGVEKFCERLLGPWYDIAGMGDSITQVDLQLRRSLYEAHTAAFEIDKSKHAMVTHTNPVKALIDYANFGTRLRRLFYADFHQAC